MKNEMTDTNRHVEILINEENNFLNERSSYNYFRCISKNHSTIVQAKNESKAKIMFEKYFDEISNIIFITRP
jgi:hypothetical protein